MTATTVPTERGSGWGPLVAFVVGCEVAGLLGVPFTATEAGSWYDQLDKPPFNPPGWVFGPVWTALYAAMGVAAWLVWRRADDAGRSPALQAFAVQLALNVAWTPIFFGAKRPGWALAEIVALWFAVLVTIMRFRRVDGRAAWILAPYLAWVTFATMLNAAIVARN